MKIKESLTNLQRMFSVLEKGPEILHLLKLYRGTDEKIRWVTGLTDKKINITGLKIGGPSVKQFSMLFHVTVVCMLAWRVKGEM